MNNLLQFIIKHIHWFVFLIYMVVSCILLFRSNPYQQSVYLSSANSVASTVFEGYSAVTSYFGLKSANEEMQQQNTALLLEVAQLKKQLRNYQLQIPDTTGILAKSEQEYSFVVANVISNSVSQPANFITIDRGSEDGIMPEMGVVGHDGVVGIVNVVGKHTARIISLINPYTRLSCKVKKNDKFGTLIWNGEDYRYATLIELPRDGKYAKGDSVVTSGYSSLFPEGIMVGIIEGEDKAMSSNFMAMKVKLSTNFSQLKNVSGIESIGVERQQPQRGKAKGGKEIMGRTTIQFIVLWVVLVLVQAIFSKIMLFDVATPIVFIYLLLRLPIGLSYNIVFTVAFITGLTIDMYNNTQGMNALSSLLISSIRTKVFYTFVTRDDETVHIIPSIKSVGTGNYLKYAGSLTFIYCLLVFFIQAFTFHNVPLTLMRIVCSFALSLVLIYAIDSLVNTRREKR